MKPALLKDYTNPQDILGEHGLLKQLTKRVVERVLEAELTAHLGYAPHVRHGTESRTPATARPEDGADGHGSVGPGGPARPEWELRPQLVPKRQRRLEGFDAKVLSLYARGLSTREIQEHLGRAVWYGGVANADFDHYRCGLDECGPGSRGRSPRCIRSCTLTRSS